jgi:hypothetical protein
MSRPWWKRDRRNATIRMAVLAVQTTLADLNEVETDKNGGDFPWLQNGNIAHHVYATFTVCVPTNSPSSLGAPSSSSMATTSSRFWRSSSRVDLLREESAPSVSLVADVNGVAVGHVAFSPAPDVGSSELDETRTSDPAVPR